MESFDTTVRYIKRHGAEPEPIEMCFVPKNRIRWLQTIIDLPDVYQYSDAAETVYRQLVYDCGYMIAEKLLEFHKFDMELRDGKMLIRGAVAIIVPLTPKNPWPPKLQESPPGSNGLPTAVKPA